MKPPRIEIICVGTELLSGAINTHTAVLSQMLSEIGLAVWREQSVGDVPADMERVFREAWEKSDIVICSGGLGPTFDDLTREAWSKVTGRRLAYHPNIVRDIKKKFIARGLRMPLHNRRQGMVLKGAEVMPNEFGTAPGQWLNAGHKTLILLPGPGRELFPIMKTQVIPHLRSDYSGWLVREKKFKTVGVPESKVDELVRPLVRKFESFKGCRVSHSILASKSIITVKFHVVGRDPAVMDLAARELTRRFRKKMGDLVFGEDEDTLPGVIARCMRTWHLTLAVAESCTGGLVAKMLTDEPGSSDYFMEGVVSYANVSKIRRLGVSARTLAKWGAVSAQVAKEMAKGIRRKTGADVGVSVTGVAGPAGGTWKKPVGLVYIGFSGPRHTLVKEFKFQGEREWIRHRAALMALDTIRRET